ncbi:MAG: SCP2 sterol-binding domain-containing protein [Anaerolineales bacterium]|nr:SCP2 sterol-binding domain-containing protein [Anaerolineales bacterium]
MTLSIRELFAKMPSAFLAEKAAGVDTVIQFKLSGQESGEWHLVIKDQTCEIAEGKHPAPKLTISADSTDLAKILTGAMDGMQAFMQGKLRLQGDMSAAMKLMSLFRL